MTTLGRAVAGVTAAMDLGVGLDEEAIPRLAAAHHVSVPTTVFVINRSDVRAVAAAWVSASEERRRFWGELMRRAWEAGQSGRWNLYDDALAKVEAAFGVPAGLLLAAIDGVEPSDFDLMVTDCMEG